MNAAQLKALDQRLDQHADATEIILKRLDEIIANAHIRSRRLELIEARLKNLETIVLPAAKVDPVEDQLRIRDQHAQGAPDLDKQWPSRPSQTPT